MAGDNKTPNLDDWDNLPLDPDAADDWDDIPPPPTGEKPAAAEPEPAAPETAGPPEDEGEFAGFFKSPDTPNEPAAPLEPPELPKTQEEEEELDDFEVLSAEADPGPGPLEDEEIPLPNVSVPQPPTQKVELDIEGMNFQEAEKAAEEEEAASGVPPAAVEAKSPPAEPKPEEAAEPSPARKKRPKAKLLIIVLPIVLILAGLIFGLCQLLLAPPDPSDLPPPPPPPISTELPSREPSPGEMRLESFYISFPGRASDTIIELSIVLHYNDSADALFIQENISPLRDIIYRVTQGKGSLVITDNELQKVLREELRERINALWGTDRVSYVQINQIRILQ